MSRGKPLAEPKDIHYIYDGTLAGFYNCVYECVYGGEIPLGIFTDDNAEPSLIKSKVIATDESKAKRVRESIPRKISRRALILIETVFLSCLVEKEMPMLRFLLLGYRNGARVTDMLGNEYVSTLLKAERHLLHEAHLFTGFVRFADYGGALAATISPKNFVLPFLSEHFISRYSNENFVIYDKTHGGALIYENRKGRIVSVANMEFDKLNDDELRYQEMWKHFYKTIAIKERISSKRQKGKMSKRFWGNMPEMHNENGLLL